MALAACEEGLDADPSDAVALHAIAARCLVDFGDWNEACERFAAALDAVGDEGPEAHADVLDEAHYLAMGEACSRAHRDPECVFALDTALELAAQTANASKKRAFRSKGSADHPLTALDVGSSATHHRLAASLLRLRQPDRALDHLERVVKPLEVSLSAGDVLCDMHRCFAAMGQTDESEACLRRATEETLPVRAENVALVAVFRRERCGGSAEACVLELEECVARARAATSRAGNGDALSREREAEVRATLGKVCAELGRWEDAEKHLGAACARDPNNADAWLRLGELYRDVGRDDASMATLRRCVELTEDVAVDREEERRMTRGGGDGATADDAENGGGGGEDGATADEKKNLAAPEALDPRRVATRAAALAAMAAAFERRGRHGRALEAYGRMDPNDPRVAARMEEILTAAALRLQRVFRGHKAREALRAKERGRRVVRQYGARPKETDGCRAWAGGTLARDGGSQGARAYGYGARRKPLGSSFF